MNRVKIAQNFYPAGSTNSTVEYTYLEATGTIRETQTLNSTWTFPSYAGTSNSDLTQYTILSFPNNSLEETNMVDWELNSSKFGSTTNLRFMLFWGQPYTYRSFLRWTGHGESFVANYNKIGAQPTSGSTPSNYSMQYYNTFTKKLDSLSVYNGSGSPYNITSLSQLEFNNLIFLPIFTIVTYNITESDDGSITFSKQQTRNYTWDDIKPEDKTPAGQYHETYKNLFTNEFEVISTSGNVKTVRFCEGVTLQPFYGKSSRKYDKANDEYIDPQTSEDRYGYRQKIGQHSSNTSEYPTNQTTPNLTIMYEISVPNYGIMYSIPLGVVFSPNVPASMEGYFSINNSSVIYQSGSSNINSAGWNPLYTFQNPSYSGCILTETMDELPQIIFPSVASTQNSGNYIQDFANVSGGAYRYIGSNLQYQLLTNFRQFSPYYVFSAFSINYLWSTIMSFGCYIASREIDAQVAPLGDLLNGNPHIYCGNMNGDFITDGQAKQGDDIADLPQTKIGDIIQNTPYVPIDPSGGGSSDDPDSDKEVNPNKIEGTNMPIQSNRSLGSGLGFITMYNITPEQLQTLGSVLWSNIAEHSYAHLDPETNMMVYDFYVQLAEDVLGTFDLSSILNFFISLRQYPFSVGTLPITSNFGNSIYIGNGKVGIPIGSGVRVLNSSISTLNAGSCLIKPVTPYNDFRDYYNTTVSVYLPYCGTIDLNPTEVINQTISCVYAIDFYTGECTAYLSVTSNPSYIVGVANGIIGVDIPLSASAEAQLQARHIMDGANAAKLAISTITEIGGSILNEDLLGIGKGFANATIGAAQYTAERTARSGVSSPYLSGGSGGASFFAPDSVYAIIRRGTYKRPDNYPHTKGYPSTRSGRLNTFSGYTICSNPDVSGINCTGDERDMIKQYLASGVIV